MGLHSGLRYDLLDSQVVKRATCEELCVRGLVARLDERKETLMSEKYLKVPINLAQALAQYIQETPSPTAPIKIPMALCLELRACSEIIELDEKEKEEARKAAEEKANKDAEAAKKDAEDPAANKEAPAVEVIEAEVVEEAS